MSYPMKNCKFDPKDLPIKFSDPILKMKMKFFTLFLLILLISISNADDEMKTKYLIRKFQKFIPMKQIKNEFDCVLNSNCLNCTSNFHCVWITERPENGIQMSINGSFIFQILNSSYCWNGNAFGIQKTNFDVGVMNFRVLSSNFLKLY
jgi:hypothetical protein